MIVQCSECQAKYRIADEKVRGAGVKVRCAKCQHVFTVKPEDRPEAPETDETRFQPSEETPAPSTAAPPPEVEQPVADQTPSVPPDDLPPDSPPASDERTEPDFSLPDDDGPLGRTEADFPEPGPINERLDSPEPPLPDDESPGEVKMDWGNIALDEPAAQSSAPDIGLTSAPSPRETAADLSPPPPEPELPSPGLGTRPPERTSTTSIQAEAPSRGKGNRGLLVLLLLTVLGAGGYYAYPTIKPMASNLLGRDKTVQEVQPTILNVQVGALRRTDGVDLAVVRGSVRNDTERTIGMIQVIAAFKGQDGKVVAESSSFCGNLFTDAELTSSPLTGIRSSLQNELGQGLVNASLPPDQEVPFLIVLDNPPARIKEVTLKLGDWKNTGQ